MWNDKTRSLEQIIKEGESIVNDIHALRKKREEFGLGICEYSIFLKLKPTGTSEAELVKHVKNLSANLEQLRFKGWKLLPSAHKKVEAEVRKFVRKFSKDVEGINKLSEKIMDSLLTHE